VLVSQLTIVISVTEENEPMKTDHRPALAVLDRWKFKGWMVCGTALVSFAAGSLLTARLMHLSKVRADSNRVFELRVYHTVPGKVPALESIFRDVSKLIAKHDLNVVGYWVPDDDAAWANTFIYLLAHPNQKEAKQNWDALHADPAFPQYRKQAAPLIEKVGEGYRVDEVYMRPTDYSAMR
jgi:NIPSNAP